MAMTEAQLQRAVARFLDVALPADATWWHTPNSLRTSIKQAVTHKAFGMKAGVADCIIVWQGKVIALELKTDIGRLTADQIAWFERFTDAGGYPFICRSVDEAEGFLKGMGLKLRATAFGGGIMRVAA